eukprot:SAG31_NODE_2684_length_5256_cov_2.975761_1_plen_148_part_00
MSPRQSRPFHDDVIIKGTDDLNGTTTHGHAVILEMKKRPLLIIWVLLVEPMYTLTATALPCGLALGAAFRLNLAVSDLLDSVAMCRHTEMPEFYNYLISLDSQGKLRIKVLGITVTASNCVRAFGTISYSAFTLYRFRAQIESISSV